VGDLVLIVLVVTFTIVVVFPILMVALYVLLCAIVWLASLIGFWLTTTRRPFQVGDEVQRFGDRRGTITNVYKDGGIRVEFTHGYGSSSVPFDAAHTKRFRILRR
jgi:hypothetical protein